MELKESFLELNHTIVIAELHLGAPTRYFRDYTLVRKSISRTFQRINSLLSEETEELLILGDLKEKIGLPSRSVQNGLRSGLQSVLNHVDRVKIIKGNHDGTLDEFLDIEGVSFGKKVVRKLNGKKIILFHGHKFFPIKPYDIAITAHIHPAANVSSEEISTPLVKAWASFDLSHSEGTTKWVIIPAFSKNIKGVALNELPTEEIEKIMPFKQEETIKLKRLKLYYTDLTPIEEISF